MIRVEGLTEYDFKNWLIKNGVDSSIVEHEIFKKDGILSYLLSATGISNDWGSERKQIEEKDNGIIITYSGQFENSRFIISVGRGNLELSAIHEKIKNNWGGNENCKKVCFIQVAKTENNLEINKGLTYMNKDNLRIDRIGIKSVYDSDGIAIKCEKKREEDNNFFPSEIRSFPYNIGEERVKAIDLQEKSLVYKNFMEKYNSRASASSINIISRPYYYELARRRQYDVANVYIEDKQSRFFPDKKDIVYSGYMPIDNRDLVEMGSMYGPFGSFYNQTEFFEAPEIPSKTEEQIKRDIEQLSATQKQKAALYDMAVKGNRTEFSYSYLDDPRYTNQNGIAK